MPPSLRPSLPPCLEPVIVCLQAGREDLLAETVKGAGVGGLGLLEHTQDLSMKIMRMNT